jgi:arylsulfatase A-like enzyme
LLDLFPTICELASVPPPPDIDGKSLKPLWDGRKTSIRDSVFLPFLKIQRAVRDERWKLIVYPQISHFQLFDLQNDPFEQTNVVERAENSGHVQRLLALMKQWQAQVGDTLELPATNKPPEKVDLTGRPRKPDQWQPEWIVKKYFD